VPLRGTGIFSTFEGHIQSFRTLLPNGAAAGAASVVNTVVQTSLEELVDDSGAGPFSIGFG
jgi:hypothetical protein